MSAVSKIYDAHLHLQMEELAGINLAAYLKEVSQVVVNGTCPQDWEQVAALTESYPEKIIPSFGVHPWEVNEVAEGWEELLIQYLERFPNAGVGEIGLDKWMKGYDLERQKEVFLKQLKIAQRLRRPMTIHCLKAWGSLREILPEEVEVPFLLHAYGGPREYLLEFIEKGAYFSFSPYFFHERKEATRAVFKEIPLDWILLETDAPSMLGPEFTWSKEQKAFSETAQYPSNIIGIYPMVADYLRVEEGGFRKQIEENFKRLFCI